MANNQLRLSVQVILLFFVALSPILVKSQTLVTYGDQQISKQAFLGAYQKNNTNTVATEKSYRDYLALYINYRLKVKAALDMHLDTLPNQVTEVKNFRSQIVDQYVNEDPSVNRLVAEAFQRSQKDIHLQHIYIRASRTATPADTLKAYQRAMLAYADLKKGKNFAQTAITYSDDPFVKTNQGDLGYITVFSLPYTLENIVYQLKPGRYSAIFRGPGGYHIFKEVDERKALGKVRVAQVLLVFPQHPDSAAKLATRKRADSIYQALETGASIADLAKRFSGDNLSFQSGGELPEFGIGKYDPAFEAACFALTQDGQVSAPVETSFGYHIIKRIKRKPVPVSMDKNYAMSIKDLVTADPRIEIAKKEMLATVTKSTGLKDAPINEEHLWMLTDSSVQNKLTPAFTDLNPQSPLFSFADQTIYVKDWLIYRRSIKSLPALSAGRSNKELFQQYRQNVLFEYYKNHLEKFNPEFAYQLNEFRDGNLLFEIMQRKVWDKASQDSAGLRKYYDEHAGNYNWNPGADAILFTTSNEHSATVVQSLYNQHPARWRRIQDTLTGQVQADSGRFEWKQIPGGNAVQPSLNAFTPTLKNPTDQSIQFAFIFRTYDAKMPRSFDDARGMVINDYQNFLEAEWVKELAVKYPVKINEAQVKALRL